MKDNSSRGERKENRENRIGAMEHASSDNNPSQKNYFS